MLTSSALIRAPPPLYDQVMFVDESFPLWAVSSVEKGGLAWSSARVGAALAAMGCGMVVFQMVVPSPFLAFAPGLWPFRVSFTSRFDPYPRTHIP